MRRIAIPVSDGTLSAHFGHCQNFYIYDVENSSIKSEEMLIPPPHEPGVLPKWLAEKKVSDIIAGGMGQRAIDLFNQNNINVYVGAEIKPPKLLVEAFCNGTLKTNANLCDH